MYGKTQGTGIEIAYKRSLILKTAHGNIGSRYSEVEFSQNVKSERSSPTIHCVPVCFVGAVCWLPEHRIQPTGLGEKLGAEGGGLSDTLASPSI